MKLIETATPIQEDTASNEVKEHFNDVLENLK